jgi:hypothetical protein
VVEKLGAVVMGLEVGTREIFITPGISGGRRMSAKQTRWVLCQPDLAVKPHSTGYTNPLTAWALTRSSLDLKKGNWLLQTAAASSVGKPCSPAYPDVWIPNDQRDSQARAGRVQCSLLHANLRFDVLLKMIARKS